MSNESAAERAKRALDVARAEHDRAQVEVRNAYAATYAARGRYEHAIKMEAHAERIRAERHRNLRDAEAACQRAWGGIPLAAIDEAWAQRLQKAAQERRSAGD